MGIYERDNIDYGSMIDRAIKNRMGQAYKESDRIIKRGDIRAQEAKDLASTFARGMDYVQSINEQKALEDKLKELESRRDYIRGQYDTYRDYDPTATIASNEASVQMKNYKPSEVITDSQRNITITDDAKSKWLQAHPGMTEEDYNTFVTYQNSLYGG